MKKLLLAIIALLTLTAIAAQEKLPFKGTFYNKENSITIAIDLYDTTLVAPNYSFLGKMHGYMTGRLYDVWFITDCKVEKDKAYATFSNDLGADEQEILFTFDKKGRLVYEAQGTNNIRRIENKKWVKLPTKMVFESKNATKQKENYFEQIKTQTRK